MVRKAVAIMLLASLLFSGACSKSKKIAATVNGDPIYMEQVEEQLSQLSQQHQQLQGKENEQYLDQFRKQILDDLIDQKLVIQQAEKENIKVTDKEINDWISQIKKQFPSEKDFQAKLTELKMTLDDLKKNRREQILSQKMIEKIVKGEKVSDKEVKAYYDKNTAEFKDPEKAKIKWIVFSDESKANEVHKQLEGGADFAKAAKDNSVDSTTKDNGGDLGLKGKDELTPEVADAAFKMELNTLSDVIKMQQGFAIIKVEEKQPERQKTFDESKDEIKNKLLSEKQRKVYESWLKKVKKTAKIEKNI
jgi:parvulin-like peptidyl-prolyl isomerase